MRGKMWIMLLGIMVISWATPQAVGQTYAPGPMPTIGNIQTQCVEQYPAPQTRTDVGSGELVNCWIDTSTWQDTDIYTDPYGNQSYVSDTLGSITWSVNGPADIYPTVTYDSSPVTLEIDFLDADATVTVEVEVADSGERGIDPPLPLLQAFNAKIPNDVKVLSASDQPNPAWKQPNFGNPAANLGATDQYLYQLQPNNVNFNRMPLRENVQAVNFIWPDKTQGTCVKILIQGTTGSIGAVPNLANASSTVGLIPIGRIANLNFKISSEGNLEFQGGAWTPVGGAGQAAKWVRKWTFTAATNQTQLELDGYNAFQGGAQGPWQ